MKKNIRAGILSLVSVLIFIFTSAFAEVAVASRYTPPADKDQVFTQGIQIQERHDYDNKDKPIIHLSTHDVTLNIGETYTLQAHLLPGGKPVSVKWSSWNSDIAKVSSSGEITAVAPGIALISAYSNEYSFSVDQTGISSQCYVTVLGGPEDVPLLGISDWVFYYGNTKFTAPTGKYYDAIFNIKKNIGGSLYFSLGEYRYEHRVGLLFGSSIESKAHTNIFFELTERGPVRYKFIAKGNSPIKTNRGIAIGATRNTVLQKYGIPTEEPYSGDYYIYHAKTADKALHTEIEFLFEKSKGTLSEIRFYLGEFD